MSGRARLTVCAVVAMLAASCALLSLTARWWQVDRAGVAEGSAGGGAGGGGGGGGGGAPRLCAELLERAWVRRVGSGRAVRLTPAGAEALRDLLGLDAEAAALL